MNDVLESLFSVESLLLYIEKIEICDIILEDVSESLFEDFMTYFESHQPPENEEENDEKDQDDEKKKGIPLYFNILGLVLRFHSKYCLKVLKEYPNFAKRATTQFLPVGRKNPTHPKLLTSLITLLSAPSLTREDIHIRNQIFLSRCSYNLLYHVADIRLNMTLIHTIVLITTKLGHEELDRSAQHPFFKNFFSYFISQIHHYTTPDQLCDRLSYLGMFFNSSKHVRKFCVVGDGKRLVECLIDIMKSEIEKNKRIIKTKTHDNISEEEDDEVKKKKKKSKTKKIVRLLELTISTLVDILESPACPRSEFRRDRNDSKLFQLVSSVCLGMSRDESTNPVIRDGCQLIMEVLEEILSDDDIEEDDDDDDDNDDEIIRTEEEEKYHQEWLEEFEKLEAEERKRTEAEILRTRKRIVEEDEKIHEEVREKELEEKKEQDEMHDTERNFRRKAYWERMEKKADQDWEKEVSEREAWMREVQGREDRITSAKERMGLEKNRLRQLLVALQINLKEFNEYEKQAARERLRIRGEEEARRHKEARIRELENSRPTQLLMLGELRNQMSSRRDTGFESVPTPLTPLSPGGAFSRSHQKNYTKQETTSMFINYNNQQAKEKLNKKNWKEKSHSTGLLGSLRGGGVMKKKKLKKMKKKGGGAIDMSLRSFHGENNSSEKDEEKCSIM